MDEMSIRQQAEFDGKEVHGLINLGFDETDDDSLPLAKEAFVLLLVCINSHWKLPIGYFLSNGLSSTQKQTLIKHCLSLLHQNNVNVVSLTFDGLSNNFSMAKQLGCNFDDVNSLKTCFPHPSDSNQEIAVFPDPPHMLKLVRNTFGEKRCLFSSEIIDWKYVEALHKLQESEGVHLGNKLRGGHIKFSKQKMKVKLAAQLFSSSVADAIDYCHNKLKLQDFIGSEATVEFLRLINTLFDVLNSRSIRQHGYKKAVSKQNADLYLQFMHKAKAYILSLKESRGGLPILESRRKTGFLGFLICIKSFEAIVAKMISSERPDLIYFPLYKVSQDHVELLFSAVRFHGGSNDNPTARQFRSAYRKLLVNAEIKCTASGNCIPLTDVKILTVSSSVSSKTVINVTTQCTSMVEHESSVDEQPTEMALPCVFLSECTNDIVYYIAGFIVKKLSVSLKCSSCISALYPENIPTSLSLVSYKSEGKRIHPSNDVFSICKECEIVFRQHIIKNESENSKLIIMRKAPEVLNRIQSRSYFSILNQHQFDTEPTKNHLVHLMRCVIFQYFKVRLSYYCKNLAINKESVRQFFKHIVNFKGQ
ncbi:DNA transposase THAP9 [Araneus ventricosus]|uniref:DNA transposase THAP9 n=1 Tax=Araneus ventricosus TaxID=182803 RepID=A0A4Y2U1S7_ARAVE|nr:DNA transposase THAP9 [Araneus ventricosus]